MEDLNEIAPLLDKNPNNGVKLLKLKVLDDLLWVNVIWEYQKDQSKG
jgi:hypothetical protein